MQYRPLGRSGLQVSEVALGSWLTLGSSVDRAATRAIAQRAFELGVNLFDTADVYSEGAAEEALGFALQDLPRHHLVLASKAFFPMSDDPNDRGLSRKHLFESVEGSLRRLGTDHVDLVQLHSCSLETLRKGDVIAALTQARERGWTRFIGYSGDGAAARYAVECGRFDTLQTSVSIADQEAIELTLPLAAKRGMGVIAKRPLANVAWRCARRPSESYYQDYWERLRALDYPFLRDDGAVATALRFTLSVPGVHTAIVGTTRPDRWEENAALLAAGPLSAREFAGIRARWHAVAAPSWTGQI